MHRNSAGFGVNKTIGARLAASAHPSFARSKPKLLIDTPVCSTDYYDFLNCDKFLLISRGTDMSRHTTGNKQRFDAWPGTSAILP